MKALTRGNWAVALTPFDHLGRIDWRGYDALLDFYLDCGMHGIFASCASSEFTELTLDESAHLAARAVYRCGNEIPVVTGVLGSADVHKTAQAVRRLADTGVAAVVLTVSRLVAVRESEHVLRERLEQLMELTPGVPLGTYECPLPYRRLLSAELFGWLARTGRFHFHKDTSCAKAAIAAKLAAAEGSPLRFFNANMRTLPASLHAGGWGYCGVVTNNAPRLLTAYWQRREAGEPIPDHWHECLIDCEAVFGDHYPRSAKQLMALWGVPITSHCRMPLAAASSVPDEHLRAYLSRIESVRLEAGEPAVPQM